MRRLLTDLVNSPAIEAWPAWLLRPRGSRDARLVATARRVLRRKRDGRFLAVVHERHIQPLVDGFEREPGVEQVFAALIDDAARRGVRPTRALPLDSLAAELAALGIDDEYGARTGLDPVAEPDRLALAGRDRYRRPLWLLAPAARGWSRMRDAAREDGVVLEAISGFRSRQYQRGIFDRKLERGLTIAQVLAVNAAPGYSEHHGGCALDIGAPGEPPAEESFERTAAFAWLSARAAGFGFRMSYPRGNRHGVVYEPWHWCWRSADDATA